MMDPDLNQVRSAALVGEYFLRKNRLENCFKKDFVGTAVLLLFCDKILSSILHQVSLTKFEFTQSLAIQTLSNVFAWRREKVLSWRG